MTVRPVSINQNQCCEFPTNAMEELSVMAGGYIITPLGEIILVYDKENHCNVFSKYINEYLESKENIQYDTLSATKILCELGCCVYAGIRLEYIKNKLGNLDKTLVTLTIPNNSENLTDIQKTICTKLIESNKSRISGRKIFDIQYGSFPDTVYTEEEVTEILKNTNEKRNTIN